MTTIINLTPHPVRVQRLDGSFLELPKSEAPARRDPLVERVGEIEGIAVVRTTFGETVDLPEATPDTIYIVSRIVVDGNPERTDLVSPGAAFRDETGRVVGADGFSV